MGDTITIFNDGPNNRYIGGICIAPGEYGTVPAGLLPADAPESFEPFNEQELAELLALPVRDLIPRLAGFSAEQRAQLAQAEVIGQSRKTILSVIADLQAAAETGAS